MTLAELNALSPEEAGAALERCCGSRVWIESMCRARPFADRAALYAASVRSARQLGRADWLESFSHHPRIGGAAELRERFTATRSWAKDEQSGTATAPDDVLAALAEGNRAYEARFGYGFIVCATGKSAEEMLAILRSRLPNDAANELEIAAGEQMKITLLRLDKLVEGS